VPTVLVLLVLGSHCRLYMQCTIQKQHMIRNFGRHTGYNPASYVERELFLQHLIKVEDRSRWSGLCLLSHSRKDDHCSATLCDSDPLPANSGPNTAKLCCRLAYTSWGPYSNASKFTVHDMQLKHPFYKLP